MKLWQVTMTFFVFCFASACASYAELGAEQKPMIVVALGTSLTHSGGWIKPLEKQLTECLGRPVNVLDFGRDGATSDWGVSVVGEVIRAQPDVILIEFAVNDAAWFKGFSLRHSQENVKKIVRAVREVRLPVKTFLMTMSPSFGPRAWIRPQMEAYYEVYKVVADELDIGYIDNLANWKNLAKDELGAGIPDGLHPLPEVAARILVPTIAGAIGGIACVGGANEAPGGK
jgi:lysophospholipase L1-like esterase